MLLNLWGARGAQGPSQSVHSSTAGVMLMRPARAPRGQSLALGSKEEDSFCPCQFVNEERRTVSPGAPENSQREEEKRDGSSGLHVCRSWRWMPGLKNKNISRSERVTHGRHIIYIFTKYSKPDETVEWWIELKDESFLFKMSWILLYGFWLLGPPCPLMPSHMNKCQNCCWTSWTKCLLLRLASHIQMCERNQR